MKKKILTALTISLLAMSALSVTFAKSAKNLKDVGGVTASGWVWDD